MKKEVYWIVLIALFGAVAVFGQSAGNIDYHELMGPVGYETGAERTLAVYTPPGYEDSTEAYPLLILLHSFTDGDHQTFLGKGYPKIKALASEININEIADRLIGSELAKPMVIAIPDFAFSYSDHRILYHDFVIDTVLSYARENYRISEDRKDVALGGHFLVGRDVIEMAFANEEIVGTVAAYSPCMTMAIKKKINREYDRSNPVRFLVYHTENSVNFGNASCNSDAARRYFEIMGDLEIDVYEEDFEGDHYSALPLQIEKSLQQIF